MKTVDKDLNLVIKVLTHGIEESTRGDRRQDLKNEGLNYRHMFFKSRHMKAMTIKNA